MSAVDSPVLIAFLPQADVGHWTLDFRLFRKCWGPDALSPSHPGLYHGHLPHNCSV